MPTDHPSRPGEIFLIFLRLGFTSFGGPVAHLGYFRQEFVIRRNWLDEQAYADIVALCQFLPGPASSQVGIALGHSRGGLAGAIAAWLGFTLPSALLLILFALGLDPLCGWLGTGWLHGLKLVAVAVVAQALWGMGRTLAPDRERASIAVAATFIASLFPSPSGQIAALLAAGVAGRLFLPPPPARAEGRLPGGGGKGAAWAFLALFTLLLAGLPLLVRATHSHPLALFDAFFRAGALVFGGGHVVLPLLQAEVVPRGWVSPSEFMAGYGAAQALPGPLFTFAAFLGAVSRHAPNGLPGGLLTLCAIFLPGFLLVLGTLPFWTALRGLESMRRALLGVNAAVVGLLLAAFFGPVWSGTVVQARDFCLVALAFLLLVFWKLPPWLVVALGALGTGLGLA